MDIGDEGNGHQDRQNIGRYEKNDKGPEGVERLGLTSKTLMGYKENKERKKIFVNFTNVKEFLKNTTTQYVKTLLKV